MANLQLKPNLVKSFLIIAVLVCASATLSHAQSKWRDSSPHKSGYVRANGIRLNYLDWGGNGAPLVMIHGIGDSPHIFDDLAPHLRDRFRVIAYARRGHGSSDAPKGPYEESAYVEDLRQLLDHLKIKKASLLGWSMGGLEITKFANLYPSRVEKLIYLDSGYDLSESKFLSRFNETVAALSADPVNLKSLDAFREWNRMAWFGYETAWTPGLDNYLHDITRLDSSGKVTVIPSATLWDTLITSIGKAKRDYTKVQAPALLLYAPVFFPGASNDAALNQKVREFEVGVMIPFREESIERVRRELKNSTVKTIPNRTHMSIGVQDVVGLAKLIRDFH